MDTKSKYNMINFRAMNIKEGEFLCLTMSHKISVSPPSSSLFLTAVENVMVTLTCYKRNSDHQ